MRYFLTGGSSGLPKLIPTSEQRWKHRIQGTVEALHQFGVGPKSLALIAHPGQPWSIAEDFGEALAACGADTICLGTMAFEAGIRDQWLGLPIDYVLCAPSQLHRLSGTREIGGKRPVAIVAGQPMSQEEEEGVLSSTAISVVKRIFGTAELGTLGYQLRNRDDKTYQLNPYFSYRVKTATGLQEYGLGNLVVRYEDEDLDLPDLVRLRQGSTENDWSKAPTLEYIARNDIIAYLADGSTLTGAMVAQVRELCHLEEFQIRIDSTRQAVVASVVSKCDGIDDLARVRDTLLATCTDLADSVKAGRTTLQVELLTVDQLVTNERGKRPSIVACSPGAR